MEAGIWIALAVADRNVGDESVRSGVDHHDHRVGRVVVVGIATVGDVVAAIRGVVPDLVSTAGLGQGGENRAVAAVDDDGWGTVATEHRLTVGADRDSRRAAELGQPEHCVELYRLGVDDGNSAVHPIGHSGGLPYRHEEPAGGRVVFGLLNRVEAGSGDRDVAEDMVMIGPGVDEGDVWRRSGIGALCRVGDQDDLGLGVVGHLIGTVHAAGRNRIGLLQCSGAGHLDSPVTIAGPDLVHVVDQYPKGPDMVDAGGETGLARKAGLDRPDVDPGGGVPNIDLGVDDVREIQSIGCGVDKDDVGDHSERSGDRWRDEDGSAEVLRRLVRRGGGTSRGGTRRDGRGAESRDSCRGNHPVFAHGSIPVACIQVVNGGNNSIPQQAAPMRCTGGARGAGGTRLAGPAVPRTRL